MVDREIYDLYKAYAARTGVTVTSAIREAMADWYDTVGETRIEAFTATSFNKILEAEITNVTLVPLEQQN